MSKGNLKTKLGASGEERSYTDPMRYRGRDKLGEGDLVLYVSRWTDRSTGTFVREGKKRITIEVEGGQKKSVKKENVFPYDTWEKHWIDGWPVPVEKAWGRPLWDSNYHSNDFVGPKMFMIKKSYLNEVKWVEVNEDNMTMRVETNDERTVYIYPTTLKWRRKGESVYYGYVDIEQLFEMELRTVPNKIEAT